MTYKSKILTKIKHSELTLTESIAKIRMEQAIKAFDKMYEINKNKLELKGEIWKDIPEFEGFYQISNFFRLKSLDRYVKHPRGGRRMLRSKILATSGKIILCKNGILKNRTIKSIIASSY